MRVQEHGGNEERRIILMASRRDRKEDHVVPGVEIPRRPEFTADGCLLRRGWQHFGGGADRAEALFDFRFEGVHRYAAYDAQHRAVQEHQMLIAIGLRVSEFRASQVAEHSHIGSAVAEDLVPRRRRPLVGVQVGDRAGGFGQSFGNLLTQGQLGKGQSRNPFGMQVQPFLPVVGRAHEIQVHAVVHGLGVALAVVRDGACRA